jgi:hypothetical protein
MNKIYKNKYEDLIAEVQSKNRGIKKLKDHGKCFNIHHIKPRSLGGLDVNSNLVKLTHEEHFLAHKYLYLMYKDSSNIRAKESMSRAWMFMSTRGIGTMEDYAMALKDAASHQSKLMKGVAKSDAQRDKMRISALGKKYTQERKNNISKAKKGKKLGAQSKEHTRRRVESQKGYKHSENVRLKISKNNSSNKAVLQYTLDGEFIREFRSQVEARLHLGIGRWTEGIRNSANNKINSAYGYRWKFKI